MNLVPRDQMRMDSLRSITMRKDHSKMADVEDSLDKIEEDMEDFEESPTRTGGSGAKFNS